MEKQEKQDILKAGEIAKQVKSYAKEIIKPGKSLLDIANAIDDKILELGGKPAFPVNLSIDEVAAHSSPSADDEEVAKGLLKIDLGVHINGYIADTAFSLNLEDNEENPEKKEQNDKLIKASQDALDKAIEIIKEKGSETQLNEIGSCVEKEINNQGFQPIVNLSGHSMERYDLHSGISIPNRDDGNRNTLGEGLFAIEPFATLSSGNGKIKNGKQSGIYVLIEDKNIRSPIARDILNYIKENYKTVPFCSRWLVKEFGRKADYGLKQLEENGNLHQFPELVESSGKPVSQAENSILIYSDKNSEGKEKVVVTTANY